MASVSSPPPPQTDHSHMFDDDPPSPPRPDDTGLGPSTPQRTTERLFLDSPGDSPYQERPSKRQRTGIDSGLGVDGNGAPEAGPSSSRPPAATQVGGRAPPRLANRGGGPSSRPAASSSAVDDIFGGLDDDDYRVPSMSRAEMRENVINGEDLMDPLAMRRMRGDDDDVEEPKARRAIPKLDTDRLLSDRGLPTLVKECRKLRIKGKGHEASDLNNLLTMYQFWAHQMFPKSTFKEATSRVEVLCHTKLVRNALTKYYDDEKEEREARERALLSPSPGFDGADAQEADSRSPPIGARESSGPSSAPAAAAAQDDDDDDMDIEAMIAQEQEEAQAREEAMASGRGVFDDDEFPDLMDMDDDEAMLAQAQKTSAPVSLWGNAAGGPQQQSGGGGDNDEEDWAALDDMS